VNASPQTPTRSFVANHDVRIEVLAQGDGRGRVIVLLPSLGRGASDFEPIAARLAGAGYRVLRPQPRGIGQSRGPLTGIDLHDYASDVAAVSDGLETWSRLAFEYLASSDRADAGTRPIIGAPGAAIR